MNFHRNIDRDGANVLIVRWGQTKRTILGEETAMSEALKATPRVKSIQRAGARHAGPGRRDHRHRSRDARGRQSGHPARPRPYRLRRWATCFGLPLGLRVFAIADRRDGRQAGPRRCCLGLRLWSLAQLLGGLVQSFGQFFGARVLLGIGEAPQIPTGGRAVRNWFNLRDRGLPTGVFNGASSLGTALAAP